ncbi:MAG: hypothetical protein JWQ57_3603 [Mucilaginibacter sp.]|nr:hypothetical protein [Mucilaginibacter sp.]
MEPENNIAPSPVNPINPKPENNNVSPSSPDQVNNPDSGNNNVPSTSGTTSDIDFEKYKLKIDLFKWFVGSVALVLVTTIIDWGFRDRAAGLQEVQQYDKYVTDLIVLNKDPGQKRMLAQFFSNVTPSNKLKDGWKDYYKEVDKEYQVIIAPVLKSDSLAKVKYYNLANKPVLTVDEEKEKSRLDSQIKENQQIINPEIIIPSVKTATKDFTAANSWEAKGFDYLLGKDIDNAIIAFNNSENAYHSFHQVFEIANYLTQNHDLLKDPKAPDWKIAYNTILTKYSWKLPPDIKSKMLK